MYCKIEKYFQGLSSRYFSYEIGVTAIKNSELINNYCVPYFKTTQRVLGLSPPIPLKFQLAWKVFPSCGLC